jgi:SAM-dependent methyltransferase
MLADVFLANGNRVIAIEPNAEMRAACLRLHAGEERITVVDGTAEATGLCAASVEMVTVGRALHWFHLPRAMEEFRRVLKPGGWVAVVSLTRRDDGSEENCELERLLRSSTPEGTATHASYAVYEQLPAIFAGGAFYVEERSGELQLRWEELLGLAMSMSHAPREAEPGFGDFERGLRGLYERYAREGRVTLLTEQKIVAGRIAERG